MVTVIAVNPTPVEVAMDRAAQRLRRARLYIVKSQALSDRRDGGDKPTTPAPAVLPVAA